MKKCPFCGADIEDSSRFCLYCMQPLTEKEQILLHQKKTPQWLPIIAVVVSVVAAALILALVFLGMQSPTGSETPADDPQLEATPTPTQTEPSDPLHIHIFSKKNPTIEYQKDAATCIAPAVFYYSCTCGEKGSETFVHGETVDHTIVTEQGSPATCKAPGLTDGTHCSVCNTVLSTQTQIPILSHTYDNDQDKTCNVCNYTRVLNCSHAKTVKLAAVPPACTVGGLTEGKKCSLCDEILIVQTALAPLGHTEVIDQAIAATCTTDGKTEGNHCSICQLVFLHQQNVPALGHSFDSKNPAAPCSRCGILPHIHSFTEKNTDAQYLKSVACCTSPALYYYSCACGEKGDDSFFYGTSTKHTIVTEPGYPAGCTTEGLTDRTYCSTCNDGFEMHTPIPAKGHTFAIGNSPSACLACGEMGTIAIQPPDSLSFQNNTFRIDSITYSIRPSGKDTWEISVHFKCTNVSSSSATMLPHCSIYYSGGGYSGSNYTCYVQPNESATCTVCFCIPLYSSVYKLVIS